MSRLRNYSTTISVNQTISEIERMLALYGAIEIRKQYENGNISAFVFAVRGPYGYQAFQLPLNVAAFQQRLLDLKKKGELPGITKKDAANPDKARRIGWRVIKDWIDAQLTLIDAGQLTMQDVFFQYMIDGSGNTATRDCGTKTAGAAGTNGGTRRMKPENQRIDDFLAGAKWLHHEVYGQTMFGSDQNEVIIAAREHFKAQAERPACLKLDGRE